ncbi:hypothetical protein [Pararhodobacter sp. SW119]|uniref:hypothetical protein n=1 Tax=Pararhodobacter sp. SW119 TaxID=2780075 RepID=UPI001AE08F3A|nr:hypothetical protein [Pararhodobacter sp. SW119]
MSWIAEHSAVLQVGVGVLNAGIWLLYLHLILSSYRRQQETVILIHRGASDDDRARCIVSNMGSEPIYILSVIAELTIDGEVCEARVTDREELDMETFDDPLRRTSQGPLKSGDFLDIGSFHDLAQRTLQQVAPGTSPEAVDRLRVTVVAASSHASALVGATRDFVRERSGKGYSVAPTTLVARQLRSRADRRRVESMLQNELAA